jgi:hypothetical protein
LANAIVSLIVVAIMLVATSAITQNALSSIDLLSEAWKQTTERRGEMRGTEIAAVTVGTQDGWATVEITLRNEGEKALSDFADWDVTLQYYDAAGDYHIQWLAYTTASSPGDNQWTVKGIYLDAATSDPEVFEPGIFNLEEELVIRAKPAPSVGPNTTNWAIIATSNGVATSTVFQRGS